MMGKTEPKRYMELAAQKRAAAEIATDPILKRQYFELGDAYEKLAEQAERLDSIYRRPTAPRRA
jgi:hypothetical protein